MKGIKFINMFKPKLEVLRGMCVGKDNEDRPNMRIEQIKKINEIVKHLNKYKKQIREELKEEKENVD